MSNTYTLYGFPNTASSGIHWILTELKRSAGVNYEFVDVNLPQKEQKQDTYLRVNPKGRVPTLVVDGTPVTETGAIALLLSEAHSDALNTPKTGTKERYAFLETHSFVVNSILPALRDWMYADRDGVPEFAHGIRVLTLKRLEEFYTHLDKQIGGNGADAWLVSGKGPTVVDYIFTATLSWDRFINDLSDKFPNLAAYKKRMRGLESWKALDAQEKIEKDLLDDYKPFEGQYLDALKGKASL